MTDLLGTIVTIICSIIASSGFWVYLQKRAEKKDAKKDLLIGLAHDRIIHLGMNFIAKGEITEAEYENLVDYLYEPYANLGGNGTAKRVIDDVKKLRILP